MARFRARLIVPATLALLILAAPPLCAQERILFDKTGDFGRVIVREQEDGIRELVFGDATAIQSAVRPGRPAELVLPYARLTMAGLAVAPRPGRVLIVGLGGGSMPMFMRSAYPNLIIDVAELDPLVLTVAKRFFGFREDPRMKVHVGDGRKFIETTPSRYDLIFLDAFGENEVPYALTTRQFLEAVRGRLTPGGAVVANLWSTLANPMYPSMLRTYMEVFPEIHILRVGEKANRILIALPRKTGYTRRKLVQLADRVKAPGIPELRLGASIQTGYEQPGRMPNSARVLLDRPQDVTTSRAAE